MAFSTRLFVGNLPDNFNEKVLRDAFSSYGDITNFDLKTKPGIESDKKTFAFVTISGSNLNVESCIKYFANEDFQGNRLYVTRARESFLERLQREREQTQKSNQIQDEEIQSYPIFENFPAIEKQNFNKRKFIDSQFDNNHFDKNSKLKSSEKKIKISKHDNDVDTNKAANYESLNFNHEGNNKNDNSSFKNDNSSFKNDDKKQNSDKKRLESMKKKRQEFNEKKNIIKSGLISIDKKPNKKTVFSDTEEDNSAQNIGISNAKQGTNRKTSLFEDDASDDEINFEIKNQFEGKKGQKVLDLQSRYKSDKRFTLDERFVEEDSASEKEYNGENQEEIEIGQADERSKQLNILQDVLGVTIKTKQYETTNKTKPKLGMLRFDPMQPEHAKYLAPVETKQLAKKSKKKKSKDSEPKEEDEPQQPEPVVEKVEVSKEQFYKISDTLKEAISQPSSFSLRSLFTKADDIQEEPPEEDNNYITLQSKKGSKLKNPLEPGEKNPFVYDSSESENEEEDTNQISKDVLGEKIEPKMVWRENLFFSPGDNRLTDGLLFFTKINENSGPKERRELKSLMKKRIYNKERKNTMFRKKIGGRKKSMKKKIKKG